MAAILVYVYYPDPLDGEMNTVSPCSQITTYRVGNIDERFFLSENELLSILKEAADIWSEPTGNPLFKYSPDGEIAVNLVYGDQQQLSDREKQVRSRINTMEQEIVRLEREYNRHNREYERQVEQYERDVAAMENQVQEMNTWVRNMNRRGGFTDSDLKVYENQKNEIDRNSREIEYRGKNLELKAGELNRSIAVLNEKIDNKNRMVDHYNQSFAGSKKFTQGEYKSDKNGRRINVYQYIDRDELKLVLAHEMGHSLGIGHVSNPKSVMFRLMDQQNRSDLELSSQDIEALRTRCGSPPAAL